MVGSVRVTRKGVAIELIVPVHGWPAATELVRLVRQAAIDCAGESSKGQEPTVDLRVMAPDEQEQLIVRLSEPPGGEPPRTAPAGGRRSAYRRSAAAPRA